jgi:ribosome-binding factor A
LGDKKSAMESTRQKKVARLLQKEIGRILQHKASELGGKLITVTVVRMSPDLSLAKIYLSFFPLKKGEDPLIPVKEHIPQIRHELGNLVRNQLRIVPELAFFIDDSLDYIEKIENLLK